MPQQLASKEASLFRQVLKHYETKQYKKGLKAAEQILRKNPKHGETLAMKGLIINCQGKSEEAFSIAKEALKHDMQSHVCWHVYGLLYRSEKNFDEAIKAYKMALRFEPESQQILRDLALLQIQMRDYQGYIDSRRTMVISRPQVRQNWTGLAVAYHLAGELSEAEKVLTKYEETLKQPPPRSDQENSEAILYKNYIIREAGEYERALTHLETIATQTLDRLAILERRAEYHLQLGNTEKAEKAYRVLIDRNQEKREYYAGLEKALNAEDKKKLYDELATTYPKADAPKRIPLDFLEGDGFRSAADTYIQRMLKKGVPSTFANLKALYADDAKRDTIQELVESFLAQLREEEKKTTVSDKDDKITNGDSSSNQALMFTVYYLAQHYDHLRIRDTQKAITFAKEAVELDPSKVEFRMGYARILKRAGDMQAAVQEIDKARLQDPSDRFINTKCSKYMVRLDKNEEALKTMSLFTRNDAHGGPLGDLLDMQCVWYITEDGESYYRQGKLGLALKRFHSIFKIFEDWTDDQFDFHSFSLRKGMIRSYIEMVRWEDSMWSHPFFARAAFSAIKIYLALNDKPHLGHDSLANGGTGQQDFENMSTADRKKALKKAKREAQKQEKEAAGAAAKAKDERKTGSEEKKQDEDPLGVKLAQTKEPLVQAQKWLKPLLEFSPKNVESQTIGFEVYMRKKKYLLALKCLLAAAKIVPEDPTVHEQAIHFKLTMDKVQSDLPPAVSAMINQLFDLIPKDASLAKLNDEFLEKHSKDANSVFAVIRADKHLDPEGKSPSRSEKLLLGVLESEQTTLKEALQGLSLVKEQKGNLDSYKAEARKRWPLANAFQDAPAPTD